AIAIEIARHYAEPVSLHAAIDPGFLADVREVPAIIPVQAISRLRMPRRPLRFRAYAPLGVDGRVEEVHVQVAVAVVVKEQRLRRESREVESELFGPIRECAVAVVDVQHVAPMHAQIVDAE